MGRKFEDITGQRFGRLVAVERLGLDRTRQHSVWLCECDCGNFKAISVRSLKRGETVSCGCFAREQSAKRAAKRTGEKNYAYKHGAGINRKKSRLYRIWSNMKNRCINHNCKAFPNYGGRGITVCAEWLHDFKAFQEWALSHGYRDGLTLDRIDNDKGYSSDNCRWATKAEQSQNRRPCELWNRKKKTTLPQSLDSMTGESR